MFIKAALTIFLTDSQPCEARKHQGVRLRTTVQVCDARM
ncbi:MAG: hypothetical protein JWR18_223 [Segetibacter sp.]|nr:hypothetical protein [Segetibacter sp.]